MEIFNKTQEELRDSLTDLIIDARQAHELAKNAPKTPKIVDKRTITKENFLLSALLKIKDIANTGRFDCLHSTHPKIEYSGRISWAGNDVYPSSENTLVAFEVVDALKKLGYDAWYHKDYTESWNYVVIKISWEKAIPKQEPVINDVVPWYVPVVRKFQNLKWLHN
tara:strand:- start:108 stop:605 length:498 start_codon:yes stop_codon:yes gene_type:complete